MAKENKDTVVPPKKPPHSYLLFANEKRPQLKEKAEYKKADGKQDVRKIAKTCGELWKKMTEAEQKPYKDKAEKLNEEYKIKMAEFKKKNPDFVFKKKKKKGKKDKNKPKKPMSGYLRWCQVERPKFMQMEEYKKEGGAVNLKEIMRHLGKLWRTEVTEDVKKKYNAEYEKERPAYEKKLAEYKKKLAEEKKKSKTTKKTKQTKKPKREPSTDDESSDSESSGSDSSDSDSE